jgi:hypothetical protein
LEYLEDRTLPSSYSAANASDLIADINAANAAGGTNTIVLTAPSTSHYVFTTANNDGMDGGDALPVISGGSSSSSGKGKKVVTTKTRADILTIIGNGDTIEGRFGGLTHSRMFDVASGASLTLQNLTLTGGNGSVFGGAICNSGMLVLDAVTVTGNKVTGDAGAGGFPSVAAQGGGVYSNGSLTVQDGTVFQNNVAQGGGGPYAQVPGDAMGGAVFVAGGNVTISNTTFQGNEVDGGLTMSTGGSGLGGALYVASGQVTITTSTVTNNNAYATYWPGTSAAGGIYIAGGTVYIDAATIANITNNSDNSGLNGTTANIDGSYILRN